MEKDFLLSLMKNHFIVNNEQNVFKILTPDTIIIAGKIDNGNWVPEYEDFQDIDIENISCSLTKKMEAIRDYHLKNVLNIWNDKTPKKIENEHFENLTETTLFLKESNNPLYYDFLKIQDDILYHILVTSHFGPMMNIIFKSLGTASKNAGEFYTWGCIWKNSYSKEFHINTSDIKPFLNFIASNDAMGLSNYLFTKHNNLEYKGRTEKFHIEEVKPEWIVKLASDLEPAIKECQDYKIFNKYRESSFNIEFISDFKGFELILLPLHAEHILKDKKEKGEVDSAIKEMQIILSQPEKVWHSNNGQNQFIYQLGNRCVIVNNQEIRTILPKNRSLKLGESILLYSKLEDGTYKQHEFSAKMTFNWNHNTYAELKFQASQTVDGVKYDNMRFPGTYTDQNVLSESFSDAKKRKMK